jgi:NADH-quinone oxidoreductase subunit N
MIFTNIYSNTLEFLVPEIFLTTSLLILLLFGVFFKQHNNKYIYIIDNINTITMYLLVILFLLIFNMENLSILVLNNLLLINNFTQFIKLILVASTLICIIIQKNYIKQQKINSYEMIILILISLLGLMLLVSSNNLIILYLAIELQSLSFYILTALKKKSILSIESSLKYFILGSIASGFILLGSSILYGLLGSLNFNEIFLLISNINFLFYPNLLFTITYGLIFILVGFLFKIGSAPFHFWLPDVYEGAPTNITAFFVIVPKIAFLSILIRFMYIIFYDISFFFFDFFYIVSSLSLIIGTLSTLQQKKIKRLLAFSSITHIGFILIAFTSNNFLNIKFILFYILIYIITNINLWTSYISLNINNKPIKYLTELSNLFSINKGIVFILLINLFSLAGIPPLAGFFSKFFIFLCALKSNYFNLIFLAILVSIISSFYYLKLIKILIFEQKNRPIFLSKISKIKSFILIIGTKFICLFFLFPNFILNFLNKFYLLILI